MVNRPSREILGIDFLGMSFMRLAVCLPRPATLTYATVEISGTFALVEKNAANPIFLS